MPPPNKTTEEEDQKNKLLNHQADWLSGVISQCQGTRFYGRVTINFQNGIIETVEHHKTLRPPKL